MESMGAVNTPLPTGNRMRFFVGMAHIKALLTDRLAASFTQVEVVADITTSYYSTSQISSDSTFVRDIAVQLREVKHRGSENKTKFATITIIVPDTLTSLDAANIIPPTSLTVSVGRTREVLTLARVYPCVDVYADENKVKIDDLLATQSRCALQDPICRAQGPTAVGPGGSIQFTFALPDSTWDDAMLAENQLFRNSLFIDLMLQVTDANGRQLLTSLHTQTLLETTSIVEMCFAGQVVSDIRDVVSIDIFLGLVGQDELFNVSLVQNLDIAKQAEPLDMRRTTSSTESNIMTIMFKGDPELFEQEYAQDYVLAVEDVITLHFLDEAKLLQVKTLIADGNAFQTVQPSSTDRFVLLYTFSQFEFEFEALRGLDPSKPLLASIGPCMPLWAFLRRFMTCYGREREGVNVTHACLRYTRISQQNADGAYRLPARNLPHDVHTRALWLCRSTRSTCQT